MKVYLSSNYILIDYLFCFFQVFPQIEVIALTNLRQALSYYQTMKKVLEEVEEENNSSSDNKTYSD